jgi:hypothetical protein
MWLLGILISVVQPQVQTGQLRRSSIHRAAKTVMVITVLAHHRMITLDVGIKINR